MQKRYIKINTHEIKKINDFLINKYGLPKIVDRLNLYIFDKDRREFQVKFRNSNISFKENKISDVFGWIGLKNQSIKSFFQTLKHLDFNTMVCGRSNTLEFNVNGKLVISIFKTSLKGSFVEFEYSTEDTEQLIHELVNALNFEDNAIYDTESFSMIPLSSDVTEEHLFDRMNRLNDTVRNYCISHGVDIRTDNLTLKSRLEGVSNDYGQIEPVFKEFSSISLVDGDISPVWDKSFMKGVSIIIPSYNSEDKIIHVLKAINSQSLSEEEFKLVEVIIVDDCSTKNILDIVNEIKNELKFDLKSARLNQNMDVSFSRNAGVSLSKFDNLIILDSDILMSKDYIKNIVYRLQLVPNAVFTTFRKNITLKDEIIQEIDNGLCNPIDIDDSRVVNKTKHEQVGWDSENKEIRQFNIFDDTNAFKNLGFGSAIGVYDLPGVLSGHNIAVSKENFNRVKGFFTKFKGWGMEDKFFGLNIVLEGNFIIPVTSSMVYHIDYGPRNGDLGKKITELESNYEMYKKMLGEMWN